MSDIIKRPDIMGNIPEIGDVIVYNPPGYKGLEIQVIDGFAKSGLPKFNRRFTPKTGFVIVKKFIE